MPNLPFVGPNYLTPLKLRARSMYTEIKVGLQLKIFLRFYSSCLLFL